MIDLTSEGYVPLGNESSVAVMDAKTVLAANLPRTEEAAADLETVCNYTTPAMKRTNVQRALREMPEVWRIGKGKKKDPHRWFRPMTDSAQTKITTQGRKQDASLRTA